LKIWKTYSQNITNLLLASTTLWVNVEHWDKAVDAFDEKNYKEAALEVIRYINSNALKDVDTSGDVDITGYQGSAQIQIHIDDKTFRIKVPFLKLNEKPKTVALFEK